MTATRDGYHSITLQLPDFVWTRAKALPSFSRMETPPHPICGATSCRPVVAWAGSQATMILRRSLFPLPRFSCAHGSA